MFHSWGEPEAKALMQVNLLFWNQFWRKQINWRLFQRSLKNNLVWDDKHKPLKNCFFTQLKLSLHSQYPPHSEVIWGHGIGQLDTQHLQILRFIQVLESPTPSAAARNNKYGWHYLGNDLLVTLIFWKYIRTKSLFFNFF